MKFVAVLVTAGLTAANFAHAATITVESRGDRQPALVSIDGELEFGDGDQFRSKTSFLSKAIVSFRSDRGSVVAGIQIGESIRLKGFTTSVAGNARCASACALAWLGGTKRFMSAESKIGFHAAYNEAGKETGIGNALVGAYLNKIGLPYSAVVYITQAAPDSMTWLSFVDAEKRGIDVEQSGSPRDSRVAPVAVAPSAPLPPQGTGKPSDDIGRFVSTVLSNIEAEWTDIFRQAGQSYRKPVLRLYQGQTDVACAGVVQSAMGPFYCPNDERIYLDTSFFREIETRFLGCEAKACEFSQAYVIAHEVGHHVQNLLGVLPKVQQTQQRMDRAAANHLQVQVELQVDCLSGLWANHENARLRKAGKPPLIEPGDIEVALRTASAIGDETLQRKATGRVVPDSFTHGTSEQRQRWFTNGYHEGTVASCNTFRP